MAVQPGVKVKNLREINKALDAIGVPKDAIKDAGKESGALVANEARGLVPVRTGALRNSIRVELQPGARLQSRQVTTEVLAQEFLTLIRFTGAGSKDT